MQEDLYLKRKLIQFIHDNNPLYWHLGLFMLLRDGFHSFWKAPITPYSYSRENISTSTTLSVVMEWISASQDSQEDGGFSAYFSLYGGFGPSYPETTGYLIPTLIDYAKMFGEKKYSGRAEKAAKWLLGLQFSNGAFPGGFAQSHDGPSVFNTGQILFGLIAMWKYTQNTKYYEAAVRTGKWLISVQSDEGVWEKHIYEEKPHIYYSMVAWALAELFELTDDESFKRASKKNIQWVLSQQKTNGWFGGYNLGGRPIYLHFIAYTLQGLFETAQIFDWVEAKEAVYVPAEKLMNFFELRKYLAGAYTSEWKSNASYACLTGNAQISVVWQRISEVTGDLRFLNAALKNNEFLKSKILIGGPRGISGGVKGSDPVWGKYLFLRYPNWAAKFTADTFMQELRLIGAFSEGLS